MSFEFWHGVNVIEWGHTAASAFCGRLLADMGARVVKVEPPDGDPLRLAGPFPEGKPHPEKSGLFLALNTNKLGVTLNPIPETGRHIFRKLLEGNSVLIEDWSPGDLERWHLTYADLTRMNRGLVMVSITPFGASGPFQDYKATDLTLFHMSGYARAMVRTVEDPTAKTPLRAQSHQVDLVGGLTAAVATAMALFRRSATQEGAFVDVSLWEAMCMINHSAFATMAYQQLGEMPRDEQVGVRGTVAILPTKDGYIVISPREDDQWTRWIDLIGNPSWAKDPRFATRSDRSVHWDELEPLLAQWTSQHSKEEIYHLAQDKQIPSFPMNTVADLFRSEHLRERAAFREVLHPVAGPLPYPTPPFRLGGQESAPDHPAPLLGEHTERLLADLGVPTQELAKLRAIGVI